MAPLTDLALVGDLHVVVAFQGSAGADEVFLLDLHLDEPAPALDDSAYLASLSPVVSLMGPTEGCVVRIGREHRLGTPTVSALDISVSLPRPNGQADETDPAASLEERRAVELAVAAAFRDLIASAPAARAGDLGHDEALATARTRVAELVPAGSTERMSVVAEEHVEQQWAVRLVDSSSAGYEVHIGFVDGHPGTTHLRRLDTGEVVDSVGSE
jgi:hypothetical protein